MLNVLKQLQAPMTSKDDNTRAQATKQFREYIEQMTFSEDESDVLFDFFVCKLSDPQSIVESTQILQILCKQKINPKLLSMIKSQQIFIPGFQRVPRINLYSIFLNRPMTHQLASTILMSIAGEKDPRNILVAFQLIDQVLENEEIAKQYKNEIFEFLDCYYPIEFQENADKRFFITKSEIDAILNKCLFNKVLINDSVLLIQDKIVSPYGAAQSSALESVVWILENSTSITQSQMDDIYDSIQRLSEQIIMDDKVIDLIPITLKYLVQSPKYPKLAQKIMQIAFKTVEEIPATQQGFIYFNLLKKLVKNNQMFHKIVKILIKKFDTCNINVTQKRLETIISIIAEYKKESIQFSNELNAEETEQLIQLLKNTINIKVQNVFILGLKVLQDIIPHFQTFSESIEQNLLEQIVNKDFIEQKCILDYLQVARLNNINLYQKLCEYWDAHNQILYVYSLQCSFVNIENYFENFIKTHIFSNQNQYLNQYIEQVKNYLNTQVNEKQICNILAYLKEIDFKIEFQSKNIKRMIQLMIQKTDYPNFWDDMTLEKVLSINDRYLLYYIPFFNKNVSNTFLEEIKQYLDQTYYGNEDITHNKQFIYKLIFKCLQQSQWVFQIDENQKLSEMQRRFNLQGLNQLEIFKIVLRQQLLLNNQQAIQAVKQLMHTEPKFLMYIIKQKDLKMYKQPFLIDLIQGTQDKQTLNYLINIADETLLNEFQNKQTLELLVDYFNEKNIDQLKQLSLIVQICDSMKQSVIEMLINLSSSDNNVLFTILTIIMNKFEEVRYNVKLYNQAMEYFNKYLKYPKRIVRKAASEAVNEWCIVFGKGI